MNKLSLAVLIPTRGRPDSIRRVIENLADTVVDRPNTWLMFGVDKDDEITKPHLETLAEIARKAEFKGMIKEHERTNLSIWYGILAMRCPCDVLMYAGDDVEWRTKGWDEHARDFFSQSTDRVHLLWYKDEGRITRCGSPFPDHGLISRWAMLLSGYGGPFPYFSADLPRGRDAAGFTDIWLHTLYGKLDRLVYCVDYQVEHLHWRDKQDIEMDDSYFLSNICTPAYTTPTIDYYLDERIEKDVLMMKKFISYAQKVGREHLLELAESWYVRAGIVKKEEIQPEETPATAETAKAEAAAEVLV